MANRRPLLGIITALTAEARCIGVREAPVGEPVSVTDKVLLIRCGIGRARARQAAQNLVRAGVEGVLSWGTAAALVDDLEPGELVLPRDVVARNGRHYRPDVEWHRRLWGKFEPEGGCRAVGVAEAEGVLADGDDKLRLHTLSSAHIADMESAAIAEVAHGAGVAMSIIRVVSDSVTTRIPNCALAAVDGNGDVDPMRCLWRLLAAPTELPSLLRLAREFRAARARLSRVAGLVGPEFLVTAPGCLHQIQA